MNRPAVRLFHFSAAAIAIVYGLLAWQSGKQPPMALLTFGLICAAAFALSVLSAWCAHRARGGVTFGQLFFWCAVVRVIAVAGEPIYEDDHYRYLWDGRETVEQGTPYGKAPAESFEHNLDARWEDILGNINNPHVSTIYGPVNQYVFALGYLLRPGDVRFLQFVFAAADLLVILVLARLAHLVPLVLYGFSPLVLKEISFTAHPDVLSVLGLLLATLAWQRGRLSVAAIALAFAVSAKLFALLLVPLLLRWRWRSWLLFFGVTIALHAPLLNVGASVEGLQAMAGSWIFNAPLYYLSYKILDLQILKLVLLTAFIVACALYFFRSHYHRSVPPAIPRADLLFFAMLIVSPVFNPWYLLFALVYAVIYPRVWVWTASLTVLFAYATGLQLASPGLEPYEQPAWALWAEFLPIALAALLPLLKPRFGAAGN